MEDALLTERLGRMILAKNPDIFNYKDDIKRLRQGIRDRILTWEYGAHINWKLTHPKDKVGVFHLGGRRLAEEVDKRINHNYYLSEYTDFQIQRFYKRLLALDCHAVKDIIEDFVNKTYAREVDGISVFGGFLYGYEQIKPKDIDFTVCIKDSDVFESPVDLHIGSLEVTKKGFVRKPSTDKLGLIMVGDKRINGLENNGFLLDAAVWENSTGLTLYGNALTSTSVPECALIYKLIIQTVWGFKHLLYEDIDHIKVGINRLVENWYAINYLLRQLGIEPSDVNSKAQEMNDKIMQAESMDDIDNLRDFFYRSAMEQRRPLIKIQKKVTENALACLESLVQ